VKLRQLPNENPAKLVPRIAQLAIRWAPERWPSILVIRPESLGNSRTYDAQTVLLALVFFDHDHVLLNAETLRTDLEGQRSKDATRCITAYERKCVMRRTILSGRICHRRLTRDQRRSGDPSWVNSRRPGRSCPAQDGFGTERVHLRLAEITSHMDTVRISRYIGHSSLQTTGRYLGLQAANPGCCQ
jgi:hypothetical protein